ncbi:CDP-archaeol synthase [archaeon]|nr:CDP-archaeol synthase [archaeon]
MMVLLYTITAYLTNASCTLAALLKSHPLDAGLKLGGKRLLGNGKTLEGFLIGLNTGLLSAVMLGLDFRVSFVFVLACLGGDLLGSFIKRRLDLKRGEEVPLMDQLGFLVTGFSALSFYVKLDFLLILLVLGVTYFIHRLSNLLAYKLGLKKVPW